MDCYENIGYEIRYGRAVITGYLVAEVGASIDIPERIDGYPVVSINAYAFENCPMSCVTLPEGLTEIGEGAFQSCPLLSGVYLSSTVTIIGDYAFRYCSKLRVLSLLGDSLTYLGSGCFYGCENLRDLGLFCMDGLTEILDETFAYSGITDFRMPDSVRSIGSGAFRCCSNLMNLHLGSGLTRINDSALAGCSLLREVFLPESVVQLGRGILSDCMSLESVRVSERNPVFHSEGNCLILNKELVYGCKNSWPPEYITTLGDEAFDGQKSLTSISLPDGVTRIGENCFRSSGLVSIALSSRLETIGHGAFSGCKMLAQVERVPPSLSFLGKDAFAGCVLLYSIDLQETGILCIDAGAFSGCSKLYDVRLPRKLTKIRKLAFADCIQLEDITFPDSLKKIAEAAFLRTGLRSVYLPEGIDTIESETFAECYSLRLVYFPNSIRQILCSAFYGCRSIQTVLGKSLEDIQVDHLNFRLFEAFHPSRPPYID